jgi:hypothetical protein
LTRRKGRRLERAVVHHYGRSAGKRIGLTALLAAVGVLVRRHPRAALHMAAAGMAGAGRAGLHELKQLAPGHADDAPPPPLDRRAPADDPSSSAARLPRPRLSRRERQAFLRFLKQQAREG